jgi:hypothetical protein
MHQVATLLPEQGPARVLAAAAAATTTTAAAAA